MLDGQHDVLLSAATASGKTEAVFLPALTGLLQAMDVQACRCEDLPPLLASILDSPPSSADQLVRLAENKRGEKYDDYLPEDLLCSEFASRMLDLDGALKTMRHIVATPSEDDPAGRTSSTVNVASQSGATNS